MNSIIFIAPPAAGKGTYSKMLTDKYNLAHISTGDLLREASKQDTEQGRLIANIMESGNLVSDDIIYSLIRDRLSKSDCKQGYILDGFPRNIDQAYAYENILKELNKKLGVVIYLDVDKEICKKRIVGRISCPQCGAVYNSYIDDAKPINEGICNHCHSALVKRNDDNEETFEKRFATYKEMTQPLIDHYNDLGVLYKINTTGTKEEIFSRIENIVCG
jgi:adenylate kinase